jgi:hypothetical protein
VSQRAVEAALGRLISDRGFRDEFFENAEAALGKHGLAVTTVELAGLRAVRRRIVESVAARVDAALKRDVTAAEAPRRAAILQFPIRGLAGCADEEFSG